MRPPMQNHHLTFFFLSHLDDAKVVRYDLRHLVQKQNKEVIVAGHSYGAGPVLTESIRGFGKQGGQDGGVIHCLFMSAFVGCKEESMISILDHELPGFLDVDLNIL